MAHSLHASDEVDAYQLSLLKALTAFQSVNPPGNESLAAFRAWVQSRTKYPVVAMENQIQGRVTMAFVVDKTGKVGRIQVLSAPDRTLGEEAQRVIESSPAWTPGKQRGNPVLIRFNLPVEFKLQ